MDLGLFLSHTLALKIGQHDEGLPKQISSYVDFDRMMQHHSHRSLMKHYMALYEKRRSFVQNGNSDRIYRYWLIWQALQTKDQHVVIMTPKRKGPANWQDLFGY